MKQKAIVYTSNTGFTKRYAELLGKKLGLPIYELEEAEKKLSKDSKVIYMGWLMANTVKSVVSAMGSFNVSAVCGVGLCETGTAIEEVRAMNRFKSDLPVFTLQGGMDRKKLKGLNKFMIWMLERGLKKAKNPTDDDKKKLELISTGGDFVSEENLAAVIEWYTNDRKQG